MNGLFNGWVNTTQYLLGRIQHPPILSGDSVNTQPTILGLAGKARSGKDTVGDYLVSEYGFRRLSFARPIKQGLAAMLGALGITEESLEEDKEAIIESLGVSKRYLSQTLGTEWGRDLVHPDLWVLVAKAHVLQETTANPDGLHRWVITDVRFENEAAWLRESEAGSLVHLTRPIREQVRDHVSEAGIVPAQDEPFIVNQGTIADLYDIVDDVMLSLGVTTLRDTLELEREVGRG